jgi:phenylpropionate dioxygenase-like ring-hydroxylating dioxygenase large terminal subunit
MASEWTDLLPAKDLSRGEVREIAHGGRDLLIFRTGSGELRAMDAYCPHMRNYIPGGLAPGTELRSLLRGEGLECPFHGWRFDGRGRCSGLPQGQRTPPRVAAGARIMSSWEIREYDGVIQVGAERPLSPDPKSDR